MPNLIAANLVLFLAMLAALMTAFVLVIRRIGRHP